MANTYTGTIVLTGICSHMHSCHQPKKCPHTSSAMLSLAQTCPPVLACHQGLTVAPHSLLPRCIKQALPCYFLHHAQEHAVSRGTPLACPGP
jgi:hypothetical protein